MRLSITRQDIKNRIKNFQIQNQLQNHNYIYAAQQARKWINRNTISNRGIVITSKQRIIYQEVTGYYIPTLLQWGMRERAINYARYLCSIQEPSGAWLNFAQTTESVFNTGQVLRGLVDISNILPEVTDHLLRGCDWLLSNMEDSGRLASTKGTTWPDNGMNSELIHLYCLPPIIEVGRKFGRTEYIEKAQKILSFYKQNYMEDILNFNYLSHFYAYVLEALYDLGEVEIVIKAMNKIARLQRPDGAVPAYKDCSWVCSTGLFQLAIVWFKLGDWKRGNKAFDYAVSLQNKSGGWYGGYPTTVRLGSKKVKLAILNERVTYFPDEEISWAVKYFFDALFYREKLEFKNKAHTFITYIDSTDLKYQTIQKLVKQLTTERNDKLDILDIGCGKGRYLKRLLLEFPQHRFYGMDLSDEVMKYIKNKKIYKRNGSILKINHENEKFDMVYAAESLEHAVLIEEAMKEMVRVLKKDGVLAVIDKDEKSFEQVKYVSWIDPKELSTKQWMNIDNMVDLMKQNGLSDIETFHISPKGEVKMYCAFVGRKRAYEE